MDVQRSVNKTRIWNNNITCQHCTDRLSFLMDIENIKRTEANPLLGTWWNQNRAQDRIFFLEIVQWILKLYCFKVNLIFKSSNTKGICYPLINEA